MDIFNFSIANDWGQGFTGNLSITNPGSTPLEGWTLEFDAPFEITNLWNAEIVSRDGNHYVIQNADWNRTIPPDGTITFGFNGKNSDGMTIEPKNYRLNGNAINGRLPAPAPTPDPDPSPAPSAAPTPAPMPELAIANTTATEGSDSHANFTVSLSAPSLEQVTVEYSTNSDTARAGSDYRRKSGQLTFMPGETSKTIAVEVLDDPTVEADERFELNLSGATNALLGDAQGIATLIDNDDSAPAPAPAPAPTPTTARDSANPAPIDFSVANEWNGGFTGSMAITQTGSQTLDGWTVEFEAPFEITNIWNAEIVSRTGDRYVIRNVSWNGKIAPDQTISFGFNGEGSASEPSNYELNGKAIAPSPSLPSNPTTPSPPTSPPTNSPDPAPVVPVNPPDSGSPSPDPGKSGSSQQGDFNYGEALQKSLLFFEAQRSGPLPDDTRIEWRGDSALKDGSDVGVDLSGGYYDAGDHVKFGFPMASSMTMLSWGVVEYRDAYQQSGQLDEVLDTIKWGTDYILKAHVTDSQGTKEFWGQVGDGNVDHAYWGPAEQMSMERPAFKIDRQNPGSDLAGESAAALAAASIVFKDRDSNYSDRLLKNAEQLFEFADDYRGKYSDAIPNASSFYNSWSGYMDELSWSAAWLYKATGDRTYLDKAEQYYQGVNPQWTQNWDDKSYGAAVLLAQATGKSEYKQDAESWLNYWSDKNGGIQYTSGGLAWLDQWGALRYSANTAFIAGVYSDTVNDYGDRYADFADDQIDYILGDNPNNFSYMVGFGDDFPLNPHHRSAHGGGNINDSAPNDNILFGALVGGPASPNDNDYVDSRTDYIRNEVALDYNAGFTGALARLYDTFGGQPLNDNQLNSLPGIVVPDVV